MSRAEERSCPEPFPHAAPPHDAPHAPSLPLTQPLSIDKVETAPRVGRRVFLPFTDARDIARALNLKRHKEWCEWSKSSLRPKNIPSRPDTVYGREWRGWGDWLGTGAVAPQNRVYL